MISDLLDIFKVRGLLVSRTVADISLPDPDDLVFYETYLSVSDAYLITGNLRHFPNEKRIVSPADMVQILYSDYGNNNVLNEAGVEYLSDEIRQIISRSLGAFETLRELAMANGLAEMSMDEINQEITLYRRMKSFRRG